MTVGKLWWEVALSLALSALGLAACGQSVDQGPPDGGYRVKVQYGAESKSVDLSSLPPATVEGNSGARVSEVIAQAFPSASLALIGADFIAGADGFRPAAKSGCRPLIPVAGSDLEKGVLDAQSGNLLWAPSLGYGGCMSVKAVGEILVVNLADPGTIFTVRLGDAAVEVDLRFQQTADVGGEPLVNLQGPVKASGVTDAPQDIRYDIEGADGFRPTVDRQAVPLTWEQLAQVYINPVSRNISFDETLGLESYWNIQDAVKIHLLDR